MADYLSLGCSVVLVGTLFVAIASKVLSRHGWELYVASIREIASQRFPYPRTVAACVVAVEVTCVALISLPATRSVGLAAAVAIFGAYSFALLAALRRGVVEPCRCFGSSSKYPLSMLEVLRNLVLIGVAALGLLAGLEPSGRLAVASTVVTVGIALVAVAAVVFLEDLMWIWRDDGKGRDLHESRHHMSEARR